MKLKDIKFERFPVYFTWSSAFGVMHSIIGAKLTDTELFLTQTIREDGVSFDGVLLFQKQNIMNIVLNRMVEILHYEYLDDVKTSEAMVCICVGPPAKDCLIHNPITLEDM